MSLRSFGSDNHSGVHPAIMESLRTTNVDHAHSYGMDPVTLETEKLFQNLFGTDLKCFFVFNGTACNVIALRGLLESYESAIVADCSHMNEDECAAPEIMGRFKLIPAPTTDGKIRIDSLEQFLVRKGDQHFAQVKAISLTLPTEYGTVYSVDELKQIRHICDQHQLYLHIDGARFCNGLHFLNLSFAEFHKLCRPDIISFGGTKNGLMFGEAVLVFNSALKEHYKFLRKQMMQLPSKGRFVSAQFQAYLQNNLYREIANHGHAKAKKLAAGLEAAGKKLEFPVQSNAAFVCFTKDEVKKLREKYFFYVWNEHTFLSRLMCSFDTTDHDIDNFLKVLNEK